MVEQTLSNPQRRVVPMAGFRLPPAIAKCSTEQAGAAARGYAHNPVVSDAVKVDAGDGYGCPQPQCNLLAALRRVFHVAVSGISTVAHALSDVVRRAPQVRGGGIARRIAIRAPRACNAKELDDRSYHGCRTQADYPRHTVSPFVIHHASSKDTARERCRHQALALMERRRQAELAECLARWRAREPQRPHCMPASRATQGEST